MATVRFECRRRTDKQGRAAVRLRVTSGGDSKYVPIGLKVNRRYWSTSRKRVTASHPGSSEVNQRLAEIERTAEQVQATVQSRPEAVTARRLEQAIRDALAADDTEYDGFVDFARSELDGYRRRGQTGTHKAYQSVLRKFVMFLEQEVGSREIAFSELDAALLRRFRTFCYDVRGNAANTVGKALHTLRTFTRAAIKDGHIDRAKYAFEHITIDSAPVQKEKLTPEEMEMLADVELDEQSVMAEVRRWFLFAYYAGGMRFSDVATLRPEHIRGANLRRVFYRMEKTEGAVGVPLVGEAEAILSHYDGPHEGGWVFPILGGVDPEANDLVNRKESQNAKANDYLKKLAERAGIETHVTFHLSRNAAAWRLYQAIGDIYKVSKLLGHSSVTQTEEYLQGFEDESLDDDFLSAF
jgi:integrase